MVFGVSVIILLVSLSLWVWMSKALLSIVQLCHVVVVVGVSDPLFVLRFLVVGVLVEGKLVLVQLVLKISGHAQYNCE